jgi:hypothetical protein
MGSTIDLFDVLDEHAETVEEEEFVEEVWGVLDGGVIVVVVVFRGRLVHPYRLVCFNHFVI